MKGLIFNIQRYSLHDGDGIRTLVFFKGCPLRCPWCSNPESQSFDIEYAKTDSSSVSSEQGPADKDEDPSESQVKFGKYMTVDEVMTEVNKDEVFYRTTGGGVTLSGGEALSQPRFAIELLKELKHLGIHTALETSGQIRKDDLMEAASYLDLILFDFKIMDTLKAKEVLSANTQLIQSNFLELLKMGKIVIPRIPLIPGYTMTKENINAILGFLKKANIKEVHLLPLHHYGQKKYDYLDREYTVSDIKVPAEDEVLQIQKMIQEQGISAHIGG